MPETCPTCGRGQLYKRDAVKACPVCDARELFFALQTLLNSCQLATLEDPSHHLVANTLGLPSLQARELIHKLGGGGEGIRTYRL